MITPSKSTTSDIELVAEARQGHAPAFNSLVQRYQGLLYNITYRLIGESDSAYDAAQEAFILAYRKLDQFRGGSLRAWLARIATNCAYDQLRAKKRYHAVSIEDMSKDCEQLTEITNSNKSPEEYALAAELSQAVSMATQTLPPDQKAVLVLIDINGLSYEEAAAALDTSIGTVKSRLSRARAKMRDTLLKHPELLPPHMRL